MVRPTHEEAEISDLMEAPLERQAAAMAAWQMEPAGLLILMSPCQARCFFCAQPAVTHPPEEPGCTSRVALRHSSLRGVLFCGVDSMYAC